MSDILVVVERTGDALRKVSFEMLSLAAKITAQTGGKAEAVVFGSGTESMAADLAKYGAEVVHVADDPSLDVYGPDSWSEVIVKLAKEKNYGVILLGASLTGKDLAAVLAGKLEAGLATDCVGCTLEGDRLIFKRPIYSGKAYANVKIKSDPQIATIRPNNFELQEKAGAGSVNKVAATGSQERTKVLELNTEKSDRVDVTEASVVIAGGRGAKSAEGFKVLEDLADLLGAGIGASRAATDAGWRPHTDQIGQTGKVVSPNLYIAAGISGAIQHLAGMGASKYIVAINKDEEAPIFKVATFGIVHDMHDFVPAFNAEIKKIMG